MVGGLLINCLFEIQFAQCPLLKFSWPLSCLSQYPNSDNVFAIVIVRGLSQVWLV
jgi:hypothetical protein